MPVNPFHSLYVTETIDPEDFVTVFSPLLVHDTSALFQPGNVVLMGTQGSGKSMLLALLKPETRLAFANADQAFPLDGAAPPFISAGINLARSGSIDFGQRDISKGHSHSEAPALLEAHFADFLNYWIVDDLLESVRLLSTPAQHCLNIQADLQRMDAFARQVATADTWAGGLDGVETCQGLRQALRARIIAYRNFLNLNVDELPDRISRSKSSAGEPISVSAELLREFEIIDQSTEIFIRIDQYEDLSRVSELQEDVAGSYETVVHKMLGLRDPRVSYRIGTRRYSWPDRPRMQGTTAVLEELRNFRLIDLDELLQRKEHVPGQFRQFADDVFQRRLSWAGYVCPGNRERCSKAVLGASMKPQEEALLYMQSGKRDEKRVAPKSPGTAAVLAALWEEDPLSARLGEAWSAQKGDPNLQSLEDDFPWEASKWWRKERIPQALVQISSLQRQRMIYSGEKDVLELSSSNVLVFVSLCQFIWDAWLRSSPEKPDGGLPSIPGPYIQDEGIHQASVFWYKKIRSDRDGDARQRFVALLGARFREWIRTDANMSNPGHYGISIELDELAGDPEVERFLHDAASFGVLIDREHTNKNRGGGRRVKWYLSSIYTPYFRIPTAHTKEPRYVRAAEIREWLVEANVLTGSVRSQRRNQPSLFE